MVDAEWAKRQLVLLMREWYMAPNGAMPAYEWDLGDLNPPVHAWACWRVYQITRNAAGGVRDLVFLERCFHKLMLNFAYFANKKVWGVLRGCSLACLCNCCAAGARYGTAPLFRRMHYSPPACRTSRGTPCLRAASWAWTMCPRSTDPR